MTDQTALKHRKLITRMQVVLIGSVLIIISGAIALTNIPNLNLDDQVGLWSIIAVGTIGTTMSLLQI